MDLLFPNGFWHYLVGGALIGLGVSLIYVTQGVRAGASGILSSIFSYASSRPQFKQLTPERGWRLLFTIGLVAGALAITLFSDWEQSPTNLSPWRLAVGGLLVGYGTRSARGCTSGHGVCGLSSLNPISLVHVLTFMGIAMITAAVVEGWLS